MAKTEISFTGTCVLECSPDGLEAAIVFSSGPAEDKPWSFADISNLVQSNGITFGFKPADLQKELSTRIAKKEKNFRIVAAVGNAPLATTAEELKLDAGTVPPEWKEAVASELAAAHEPDVKREVQIKVEREKTVITKGPLPFLPGKEEKIKVTEKETRQEKVYIDTAVLSFAYAEVGSRIGQIFASKPGTPGKSVKGTMIPAPTPDQTVIYSGSYVQRKGLEITALATGIVRVGAGWLDIVPFVPPHWELDVSNDKATLYLAFTPGSRFLPPPTAEQIVSAALEKGFSQDVLISAHDIQLLINEAAELHQAFEKHPLTMPEDAFYDITVAENNLKAVLNVSKGSGKGKALVLKDVGAAINASKIKLKDRELLKKDMLAFVESPERTLIGYVLAEGKDAEPAPKQALTMNVDFLEKKPFEILKKQLMDKVPTELTHFPLQQLTSLGFVEKEQRIGNLSPIVIGQPGQDVYGSIIPGLPSEALQFKLVGAVEIMQALVVAKDKGLLLYADTETEKFLALIQHADSEFRIDIGEGGMYAWLTVDAHRGSGKMIDPLAVKKEIEKLSIKKGLLPEVLEKCLTQAANGEDVARVCIAEGKKPRGAASSSFEFKIDFATGKGVRIREDGTADYRSMDKITQVSKGVVIAVIIPPSTTPENGYDVFGKDLLAPTGAGLEYQIGNNIRQETKEGGVVELIADADGELKKEKGRLDIVPVFTVKGNVDKTTGNIKFPGTVQVSGDVMTGFVIMAGGPIKINGSVEACLLSSDQDILIQGGMKGHGKGVLRAKASVLASYIELATMLVIGDIKIKKSLLRSNVKCNGRILMADDGQLIGGEIKVKTGMSLGNLGSDRGIPTKVFFGQDVLIEDQIEVEEREIAKLQQELIIVNIAMKSSEKLDNKEELKELFNRKVHHMKMLEKRNLRLFTLKERFEVHCPSELVIKGTVFPGVIIESHGRTHEFAVPRQKIKIIFNTTTGRVEEVPLDAKGN